MNKISHALQELANMHAPNTGIQLDEGDVRLLVGIERQRIVI
jgi:hypothetical protein